MNIFSVLGALRVSISNLPKPKTTAPLPWKGTRPRAERYRASFALVHDEHGEEACIGCQLCERICPSQIITVTAGPKGPSKVTGKNRGWCADFTLDLNACIICELCVQVCPADAIIMLRVQEQPGYQREDLLLTMEKLYANEGLKQLTWARPTLLQEMQDPGRGKVAAPPASAATPAPAAPAPAAAATPAPAAAAAPAGATTPSPAAAPAATTANPAASPAPAVTTSNPTATPVPAVTTSNPTATPVPAVTTSNPTATPAPTEPAAEEKPADA